MDCLFVEVFSIFLGVSAYILVRINSTENAPYMDEVFHIPQVQNYCVGKFSEWDPMITTLPGLYITTVGLVKPLSAVFNIPVSTVCSTFWLRSINVCFAAGNLYLLYRLVQKLHPDEKVSNHGRKILTAVTLSIFPVLYFFSFLYYTDSGSTFCVLLMYLLSLDRSHNLAAFIGMISILFRQTNIVWVAFVAGLTASDCLMFRIQPDKKDYSKESQKHLAFLLTVARQFFTWLNRDRKSLLNYLHDVICKVWGYVLVIAGFVVFVVINEGIVVGAKEYHKVELHFPQIFYLVSFMVGFSFMHHISISNVRLFARILYRKSIMVIIYCLISSFVVWKFTHVHPYLLADNRHYTFYVWSWIYQRHELVRYLLIPGYGVALVLIHRALQHQNILWKCVYCVCTAANLIPSPLLEFRYFIIPYLIYRLNMPLTSYSRIAVEMALYLSVNCVTLYLFMEKPFQWENTSGYQRFMW